MASKKRARDHTKPDDDEVKPSKPVYLVAPLIYREPAYSVFMVEAAAVADGDEPLPARTVDGFPGGNHAMSFVATHSVEGSWIVGVGGVGGRTVIYDPSSEMKAIQGPNLICPKRNPILISLGSQVYAISRRPKVRDRKFDLDPWIESLSFRKGVPSSVPRQFLGPITRWKAVPSPPFFPCLLDPMEYRHPPRVSVSSYATVDSYILLSLDVDEAGTCAFHVVKIRWEKVSDKSLPFVGQAVPLGGGLFAACSTATTAAIFHMSINGSSSPVALTTTLLSTLQYPVTSVGDPLPLFCSMGKGSFCSVWLDSSRGSSDGNDMQIILTASKIDNMEAILTACQAESVEAKDLQVPVQVKYQNKTYKVHGPSPFKNSPKAVISSLPMGREVAELFEVNENQD